MALFPPRSTNRTPARHPSWAAMRKAYMMPIIMTAVLLQLIFLGNMSYIFGSVFQSTSRLHKLKVVAVDYDGGDIGRALEAAYGTMQSDAFPSIEYKSSADYATPAALREAVCRHEYWAALYTHEGASDRLLSAVAGDNTTTYDPTDALTIIYNGAYYPVVFTMVEGSLKSLTSAAASMYALVSPDAVAAANLTDRSSAQTLFAPWQATEANILPTSQGTRVLLNTVTMVMPILMQFFFQMGLNGIMGGFGLLAGQHKRDVYAFRLVVGKVYALASALGMTGYIWAFREGWDVGAPEFFETWMCIWFLMDIHYLIIDTILETLIPIKFMSFFVLTWIITNVSSTIFPFELNPGFYRVGWALPTHEAWLVLVNIWSKCGSRLHVALPVLFAWWVVAHVSSAWSLRRRCLMAEAEANAAEGSVARTEVGEDSEEAKSGRRADGDQV